MKGGLVQHPRDRVSGGSDKWGQCQNLKPRVGTKNNDWSRKRQKSARTVWLCWMAQLCCLSPGAASSTGHTMLGLTLVKWPLQASIWHLTHGARTQRALKQNISFRFLRSLWNCHMPWHMRLGEPHDCVDTGLRHDLMEGARASDQRIFEFESAPWHVLEVNVAHYLTYWSLSFPFCKMEYFLHHFVKNMESF